MKRIIRFFAVSILAFLLTGCGGTASSSSSSVDNRVEITGVTLSNSTITYDGNPHSILIEGTLPSGVTVAYTNNAKTDVGVYEVTATLTGAGYFTKSLQATLTIQNRTITGVTFSNASVVYDGALHKIEVSGTLPQGVSVSYASDVTGITNEASEVGTYHMVATLSGTAYTTSTLTATLTILPYGETTFAGITFTNQTYVYDGTEHVITISGTLPAGALVVYSSTTQGVTNAATAVGVYNVTAVISKTGYQTLTLQAVLTISQAQTQQFTGVSFSSQTIEYDSFEHEIVV
ncbi:MAG: MBG domain-containing protein, partial [Bacilli bacterium]